MPPVIFKAVGEGRPYPDHGYESPRQWAEVSPRVVRLDQLVTTKRTLDLDALLAEDSTFYGDLFAHVVQYKGVMYLEDGLHRAVRAALQQRAVLHARVLVVEAGGGAPAEEPGGEPTEDLASDATTETVEP
nr:type II toxin-antitoxin system VapB family antitoxin [Cellulomonas septica]